MHLWCSTKCADSDKQSYDEYRRTGSRDIGGRGTGDKHSSVWTVLLHGKSTGGGSHRGGTWSTDSPAVYAGDKVMGAGRNDSDVWRKPGIDTGL